MTLNKQELEKFKKALIDLKHKLSKAIEGTSKEIKKPDEATGYTQHQADQGTDDFDRTISIELTDKELSILKQIERALEKMEENTYGICDVTGEEIPVKRLEAVPYATMTVKAQEKLEKGLL